MNNDLDPRTRRLCEGLRVVLIALLGALEDYLGMARTIQN